MGFNTTFIALNDNIGEIDSLEDLSKTRSFFIEALSGGHSPRYNKSSLFKFICCNHADYDSLIISGGNRAKELVCLQGNIDKEPEKFIEELARKFGYYVKLEKIHSG